MPINSLNPNEFAKDLAQQALNYTPADLSDENKNYVARKVFEFSLIAGNHLIEKFKQQLNDEQARIIVQFIGEWTFHKNIDLARAGIPNEHWPEILQNIAFSALTTAIQAFMENKDQNSIAASIELNVIAAYEAGINKLAAEGIIQQDKVKEVISYSNVDKMAEETGETSIEDEEKILKYAALALVLKKMPKEKIDRILSTFAPEEQQKIVSCINIEGLEEKLDPGVISQYLKNLKINMDSISKPKVANIIAGIKDLKNRFSEEEIFHTVSYERAKVLDYMETCLFEKTAKAVKFEFSPYIAKILHGYVKSKLVKTS